jgi:aminoglycoside/choline kinase family phosphotransferase
VPQFTLSPFDRPDRRMTDASAPASSPTDARADDRLTWARAASGEPDLALDRASMDAGFRSYWRGAKADGGTVHRDGLAAGQRRRAAVAADSRDLLETGGVRVPRVLAEDVERGFLLLEDLGHRTYLHVFEVPTPATPTRCSTPRHATAQTPGDRAAERPAGLRRRAADARLRLFDEWFLGTHLGVALDCGDLEGLDRVYRV